MLRTLRKLVLIIEATVVYFPRIQEVLSPLQPRLFGPGMSGCHDLVNPSLSGSGL